MRAAVCEETLKIVLTVDVEERGGGGGSGRDGMVSKVDLRWLVGRP